MKIGIIIDFVCPYCFVDTEIMWKALDEKLEEMEIVWYPYELAPHFYEQKRVDADREKYSLESQFVKNVFESYWVRNENIGDIDILSEIAEKTGIPKKEFKNSLQSGEFKEQHRKENDEVSDWDFDVVPTFYIDGEKIPQFPKTLEDMKKM
ncbi:MAG: DsbA family oxidoreductase, partial [Fusobacteriaceae bacterium]